MSIFVTLHPGRFEPTRDCIYENWLSEECRTLAKTVDLFDPIWYPTTMVGRGRYDFNYSVKAGLIIAPIYVGLCRLVDHHDIDNLLSDRASNWSRPLVVLVEFAESYLNALIAFPDALIYVDRN